MPQEYQCSSTWTMAYINNTSSTVSSQLTGLAKELWMWGLDKDISLTAQHIPGVSNTIADMESRTVRDEIRLDAPSSNFSDYPGGIQTTECGPVCLPD